MDTAIRVVVPTTRVSSSLTPPAPIIPSGTPRFGAPKREEKEIWRCAFSSSPLARDPPSPTSARLLLLRASLLNQSRGATSSRPSRARPRLASPVPKIAPHALFPLLLGAQSWADEPEGEFPRIPHGFNAFGGAPHSMGGLGFQQQQHSVPGGPGLFQAQAPPGGFAEREPPNYSFGVGSPGAVAPGFAVGSPGARGPAPGFGPPGSPPGAGFGRSPPQGSAPQPGSSPGGNGYREARPARPQVPIPTAPPFTAFVGNFPYECSQDEVVGVFVANACAIADVRMVRNRDNDRPRGYFLEFEDVTSLERALKFDQYDLGGRPLRVNVAEGRPERRERHSGGFADRYTDRGGRDGRSGGGFAERYSESRGGRDGFTGGGGSFGRREGGGGYQEARGGRSDRRSFDRSRSNPDAPPPEGRKKLVLAARTVPLGDSTENIATSPPSSKPNPFGAARPVDSSAKLAEAERKIQEEKDAVNAKAGIKSGEVPAPKPKPAAQAPKQHKPKAQLVVAPKEEPHFEAKNAFDLLAIDDEGGDDDDDEDEEKEE